MLGDTSEFGPLDLLGALTLNAVSTNMACNDPSFRIGIAVKDTSPSASPGAKAIRAVTDYRFLGGLAAAAVGQFAGGETTRRAGHDIAVGLLGSFVSTETCRKHALDRITKAGQTAQPTGTLTDEGVTPPVDGVEEPAGSGAYYGYGW